MVLFIDFPAVWFTTSLFYDMVVSKYGSEVDSYTAFHIKKDRVIHKTKIEKENNSKFVKGMLNLNMRWNLSSKEALSSIMEEDNRLQWDSSWVSITLFYFDISVLRNFGCKENQLLMVISVAVKNN